MDSWCFPGGQSFIRELQQEISSHRCRIVVWLVAAFGQRDVYRLEEEVGRGRGGVRGGHRHGVRGVRDRLRDRTVSGRPMISYRNRRSGGGVLQKVDDRRWRAVTGGKNGDGGGPPGSRGRRRRLSSVSIRARHPLGTERLRGWPDRSILARRLDGGLGGRRGRSILGRGLGRRDRSILGRGLGGRGDLGRGLGGRGDLRTGPA